MTRSRSLKMQNYKRLGNIVHHCCEKNSILGASWSDSLTVMTPTNPKGSATMFLQCDRANQTTTVPVPFLSVHFSAIIAVLWGLIFHPSIHFIPLSPILGSPWGAGAESPAHHRDEIVTQTTIYANLKSVEGSQLEEENVQTPHREAPYPGFQTVG